MNNIINLNEVYKLETLWYWCNSVGDLNVPGYAPTAHADLDSLPALVRSVYQHYWTEGCGANEYVVTFNGETGLMLGWLFDYNWLRELLEVGGRCLNEREKEIFHCTVKQVAEKIANGWFFSEGVPKTPADACPYPVLYGEDTDPDGDEILLFLPFKDLGNSSTKAGWLINTTGVNLVDEMYHRIYTEVENAVKASRTLPPPTTQEIISQTQHADDNDSRMERLIEAIMKEMDSDDEPWRRKGNNLLNAYQHNDAEGMLLALCGWSIRTLMVKAGILRDLEGAMAGTSFPVQLIFEHDGKECVIPCHLNTATLEVTADDAEHTDWLKHACSADRVLMPFDDGEAPLDVLRDVDLPAGDVIHAWFKTT